METWEGGAKAAATFEAPDSIPAESPQKNKKECTVLIRDGARL